MATKTEICNLALMQVGTTYLITDVESEDTKEARTCRQFYDLARQAALSDVDWSFTRKTVALALLEGESDPQYKYVYKYPSDCLKVRGLIEPYLPYWHGDSCSWQGERLAAQSLPGELRALWQTGLDSENETRTIITDLEEAMIIYSADLDNEFVFTSQFVDVLVIRLAMYLAMPIANSPSIAQGLQRSYQLAVSTAAASNMNEAQEPQYPTPNTITSRIV